MTDPLDDLPPRQEVVDEIRLLLDVDLTIAENLVRAAEPLWAAMEEAGGPVDSWGGGEFCQVFPKTLAYIRSAASA